MNDKYIAYPLTVVALAEEIKKAVDDYKKREIDNKEIKEIMLWYANTVPDKLFAGEKYNVTISKICGKRRLALVDTLLDGYQHRLGVR